MYSIIFRICIVKKLKHFLFLLLYSKKYISLLWYDYKSYKQSTSDFNLQLDLTKVFWLKARSCAAGVASIKGGLMNLKHM